ncbi:MAG: plastocyanin/azurin family copper-binding protein [Gammaproteobacteria bacterium]
MAEDHIIAAQATSFAPKILFIQPGDTVQWTRMSPIHDAQSMEGLIPEGAKGWKFAVGENGKVTLDKEGVYVYKCNPHYAVGMAGAIIVGKATNLEQVKANATGRAKGVVIKVDRALAALANK